MSDWQGLLFAFAFVAVILILDGAIVLGGLAVERQDELAAQERATERRHGAAETAVPTAGPPSMGPAGTGVEQALGKDASSLGSQPAGATRLTPQQSFASAGLETSTPGWIPRVDGRDSVAAAGPAVGTDVEQMRGIAAACSLGPHHSSSAGADSTVPDQSSALAGIHRQWRP